MSEPTVTIEAREYADLLEDAAILAALRAAGVDNWEWYGDAMAALEEFR